MLKDITLFENWSQGKQSNKSPKQITRFNPLQYLYLLYKRYNYMAQYVSIVTVSWCSVFSKRLLKQWKENLLEPLPSFSALTKIVQR